MDTTEYAPGRAVDRYGDPSDPTVLLWHGMQTDSRAAVAPLAEAIAREHATDPDELVLVGWSMGGVAAAGLTVHSTRLGIHLRDTVCLAGGAFSATDPVSRTLLGDDLPTDPTSPFTLLHGVHDDVVPLSVTTTFAEALTQSGWPVEVMELDADHGSIAGARYDSANDRYAPSADPGTLGVAREVAARIAAVVGR